MAKCVAGAPDYSPEARITWVTESHPQLYPPDIDGRALFDKNFELYRAVRASWPRNTRCGSEFGGADSESCAIPHRVDPSHATANLPPFRFDKIVVASAPALRKAKELGALDAAMMPIDGLDEGHLVWSGGTNELGKVSISIDRDGDGSGSRSTISSSYSSGASSSKDRACFQWDPAETWHHRRGPGRAPPGTQRPQAGSASYREAVDAVVWCTGYSPATAHLKPLMPRIVEQ